MTRLGMKKDEMAQIAEFMRRIVFDQEDTHSVAQDVAQFRTKFQKVHYAFDTARDAYEYIKIR